MSLEGKKEELSSTSLLIYLLVNFPEIFTIKYNRLESKIKISFMLNIKIEDEVYIKFKKRFCECFQEYNKLLHLKNIPKINRRITKSWTLLEVTFYRKSIAVEEVSLICYLLSNQFKKNLIIDERQDSFLEKEKFGQEDAFKYLLSGKKEPEKKLFAFRDAGKVYVFDK